MSNCKFTFIDEGDGSLFLEIEGQTKDQVKNLFDNYNREYRDGAFDDSFIQYLKNEKVKFKEIDFFVDLKG